MNWINPILILLTAFIAVFLEAAFGGIRNLLGAQIDLLPALMVYASLSSGFAMVIVLALLGGFWFDSLSANPLGISVLPLLLVGILIYARRGLILREQRFAQLVLGFGASAVTPALTILLLLSTRQAPILGWGTLWQWLVMTLGGGLLTPVCFRLFDGLNHALSYRPISETSFRPDREIRRSRK
ncbi:MAG: Rod shape-determining protein MreD [Pedosphaera sp.]|nr:Rod shape-determining protein MreD [Pedosphaera sp.]